MTESRLEFQPPTTEDGGAELLAWLRQMRTEQPIWRDAESGAFHFFRYKDAARVLADPGAFSSDMSAAAPEDVPNFIEGSLATTDPPRHRQLRNLVSGAFTAGMVENLAPRITEITNDLLDAAGDEMEFVEALSNPLPVTVIAELLGVPITDQPKFRRWADAAITATNDAQVGEAAFQINDWVAEQVREMQEYLIDYANKRRDDPTGDLMSRLACAEVDGTALTDNQLFSFAADLLFAGHITTTMLLGNALMSLDEHPDALAAVRADRSLIPAALEEVLRWRPPITMTNRLVTRDTEVDGVAVPAGSLAIVWLLSANRDEDRFVEAGQFDIRRSPNPHLSFGHGIHFCIGAPLGRLEARIALNILLDRYAEIRIAGKPEFLSAPGLYGVQTLPLAMRAHA
ncbi:cytochrome P450 [Micromonospora siamensis]|uniref:Cytochrome P450 n=1 Tax=Micromonospora siamensis TaxID=299152 RepID=A0A1C5HF35_9ACTN|nr:cytochrome P450 [Micromonospora siamensis]SCG44467.1 Cytochrome P450 [Micromonospora siamensis]